MMNKQFEPQGKSAVDFSRLDGHFDLSILASAQISAAGCGGASEGFRSLARTGIGAMTLVDFDMVDPANIPTQGFNSNQVGMNKAEALAVDIKTINSAIDVEAYTCRVEDLSASASRRFWDDADLILGLTDSFRTNAALNTEAVKRGKPILFGTCYADCIGTEMSGSFPEAIANGVGCHRCFTDARYQAYAAGFENPAHHQRHVFIADLLNVQLGYLATSLLHEFAGSILPITKLAKRFLAAPFVMTRIDPDFYAKPGEMFSDIPADYGALVSRHWAKSVPEEFICPDCATPGATALQAPATVWPTQGE